VNLDDLPKVNLDQLLASGYAPVAVSREEGNEFVVVAPEDAELPFVSSAPQTMMTPAEHSQMLAERELADAPLRSRIQGIAQRGRPGTTVQDVPVLPQENVRVGIGQTSAQVVRQPRVDMASGIGVGGGGPIDGLNQELGSSAPSPFTSWIRQEYNQDLVGIKGLRQYDKMRKSDGTVRGTLRLAKTPVLAGQYSMKSATSSSKDQTIADFVWSNLTQWMTSSWPQTLTESLLMLDFGYYMFEEVFDRGESVTADPSARGKIVWRKWAPRHPMDVREWFFDLNGGPLSVDVWSSPAVMPGVEGGTYLGGSMYYTNIPVNKLVIFTFDKEAGNIEGISLLRSAYKHWYYKDNLYKIDAIQKERHGIGVPVIQLPQGYNAGDLQLADSLGRNLRTNDRAHVVLPPLWTLTFAELATQPVDCIRSIEHHDVQIEKQILGQFLQPQMKTAEADQTLFLKATRFTADIVVDVINKYAIPQLVNMNWVGALYPQLIVKRIGEVEDWRTTSFTLRNLVGAGVIVPDDPLEVHIRDELGLPPPDPATSRLVQTPQNRNIAGAPPAELPGSQADIEEALRTGQLTPEQLQQLMNTAPAQGAAGSPRQGPPSATPPSTGQGDGSGISGRRGQ
jgi:hypothetical protein